MAKRTTKKPPTSRPARTARSKVSRSPDPGDTADLAAQYSRVDQEREELQLPIVEEADEMTTGTVQDQLIYQGLEENREGDADLKRAEKARDALADRTAAASNPGSGASIRVAARSAKAAKDAKSRKAKAKRG